MVNRRGEVMKKNYVFEVVTTCQGNPFRKQYNTLFTTLLGYAKEYLTKNKYGTMNFKLQQRFL